LVTGGAGFIGSHTVDALVQEGHSVRILDNLQKTIHPKGKPYYTNPDADFILGDVRDKQTWIKALRDIDAVYHFAAYQDYLLDFSTFFHTNAVSTALLYEILLAESLDEKIRKIIVASSQAVMGEGRYRCPECFRKTRSFIYPAIRLEAQLTTGQWDHRCPDCHEALQWLPSDETVAAPCNQYALSKYSQEQIAIELGKRYNLPTVVMRYSIVQGPRQSLYNVYSGAMRIFTLSLMLDREPIIFEDGNQIRDYVNIDDVVDANLLVLHQEDANGQVFNVGGDVAWTVKEFYDKIQEVVGKKKDPNMSRYYRYGDTRHVFSDINKLKALGWKPRRDVSTSINDYWIYIHHADRVDEVLEYAETNMKQLQVIRRISESMHTV
jgi:dTDP-L-rhamnose 4-epimerase